MQRKVLAGIIALLSVTSLSVIYAFTVSKQLGVSLTVTDPLQVFSDSGCTTPFGTTINLGSVVVGGSSSAYTIYIKNAGSQSLTLYWNSTKPNTAAPGSTGIGNTWQYAALPFNAINGTSIPAGACDATIFTAYVGTGVPVGSYSWTVWIGHA